MVNEERLVNEFKKLVSFSCESLHEKEIGAYLKEKLISLGLEVLEDDAKNKLAKAKNVDSSNSCGNLYGYLKANNNSLNPLFLNGHMDTVKPGVNKKAIVHEDGLITSDGTTVLGADDAAALAEIIELLTVIKEDNLPHGDIEVIISICEEPFCGGASVFDYSMIKAKEGYTLDLSGEIGNAAIAAPTILSFNITVNGKSAHAGFAPEEGIHTIKVACNAISKLDMGHIDEKTTINIGTINGGIQMNSVPDKVSMIGEIRSLDNDEAYTQWNHIKEVFINEANKLGASVDFDYCEEIKAYNIDENENVVKRYVDACKAVNVKPNVSYTFGGSDNHHYSNNGIKGIVIACGMNACHSCEEWTRISDMSKTVKILLEMVKH